MTTGTVSVEEKADVRRPVASFREIRPEYQKNGLKHVVYFTQAMHYPSDVFAYGREAANCFEEKRYLATITMASAMVEVILNKDGRIRVPAPGWRPLTMKLVRTGQRAGLPISTLLEGHETVATNSIAFIELRNRIAHGNLTGIVGFENRGTPDYSQQARTIALKHLLKAERFVIEWYNTSPDVQQRKIIRHRWP